jgi:phage repressor protein C with HTH and peptisase S24 domain
MVKRAQTAPQKTGLFHAREARGMSRSKLVKLSGVSKQQLSRLENGQIRLRLDHLKPFASHLGYTPEQMLLWGRFPGTGEGEKVENEARQKDLAAEPVRAVPELDVDADTGRRPRGKGARKIGRYSEPIKPERWGFPPSFALEQLRAPLEQLVVIEAVGDSMAPTIISGERVIIDTGHTTPTPDGIYAIRDTFKHIILKRLQSMRLARNRRVRIISDNPKHAAEEMPLAELEVVGKVLCCLKLV